MRVRSLTFRNHIILGDLHLDFCDSAGNPIDTIILAGENGTGKTTIVNTLYYLFNVGNLHQYIQLNHLSNVSVCIQVSDAFLRDFLQHNYSDKTDYCHNITISIDNVSQDIWGNITVDIKKSNGEKVSHHQHVSLLTSEPVRSLFSSIYNDVQINFTPKQLQHTTALELDQEFLSKKSSENMATDIAQLLVDIQALDDQDLGIWVSENPGVAPPDEVQKTRTKRFNRAFSKIFTNLKYYKIANVNNSKKVCFLSNGRTVYIDDLSSGEKQIVFRGGFILKDTHSNKNPILIIDEPEISLHPDWQIKILDFYKQLVTDESGQQQSQLFVVTHSPFIIHNDNRKNDKVIVLRKDATGVIHVDDKPDYYQCTSLEAVHDAFNISYFTADKSIVYLEGRTDEKYFNKALEVFDYKDFPFRFKWIGYLDKNGQEVNTGKDALNKAVQFLTAHNTGRKNVCLFDCDTNRQEFQANEVYVRVIPKFQNINKMKKGIENALVLDGIDLSAYYTSNTKEGDYGDDKIITEFDKMKCCEGICSIDTRTLTDVFQNLKAEIDKLAAL